MSTRKAIVDTAARLFAEKGYEGMTIKEIANQVGVTPPAVYAFFKNKEDVFLQIYEELLSGHLDIAAYHTREYQSQPIKVQLERLLRVLFEYQLKDKLQMKIFLRLLLFPPLVFPKDLKEDLFEVEEMEIKLFAEIFDRGMQNGEVRQGNSTHYAKALMCMMDGLYWQMQRYDMAGFWDRFEQNWEHFWGGMKP